ncbi:MAG: hypothetical protein NT156_03880 [Mycobacterium sp.]|jgi:hypothetical protein|nr:hypothetical protein [Mycobacterium sp.]
MTRSARFTRFAKLGAANAIAGAGLCSVAIALSPAAAAEPIVPPVLPDLPALNMIQQFATNPAGIGAVLQSAATALSGASSVVGAPLPGSTLPGSTLPGSTLPVSPIQMPPGLAPVAPVPVTGNPIADYLPLLNQIGIPGSLVNLAPANLPIQLGNPANIAPAPVFTPPVAPIVPAAPAGGVFNPLPLLSALP